MGVFSRFERKLEHSVGGAFARVFKGKVHPAEIGRALKMDAEDNKVAISTGRTLVPNRYVVRLGATDYTHLSEWERQLTRSLAGIVQEHLDNEGWSTYGQVKVRFEEDDRYHTGVFEIESSVDHTDTAPPVRRTPPSAPRPPAPQFQPAAAAPPYPLTDEPPTAMMGGTPPVPPAPRATYRHLLIVDGPNSAHQLAEGRTTIGRGTARDIRVPDSGVSRQHVQIDVRGPNASVQDLGSTNGTIVNGRKVAGARLMHGDVIRIGNSVLVYRYEQAEVQ